MIAEISDGVDRPLPRAGPYSRTRRAGFWDGFFLQSADGDNRLVVGLVTQIDARFELGDTIPVVSFVAF